MCVCTCNKHSSVSCFGAHLALNISCRMSFCRETSKKRALCRSPLLADRVPECVLRREGLHVPSHRAPPTQPSAGLPQRPQVRVSALVAGTPSRDRSRLRWCDPDQESGPQACLLRLGFQSPYRFRLLVSPRTPRGGVHLAHVALHFLPLLAHLVGSSRHPGETLAFLNRSQLIAHTHVVAPLWR